MSALNLSCSNCGAYLHDALPSEFEIDPSQPASYQQHVFKILAQAGEVISIDPAQTMVVRHVGISQLDRIPDWRLAGCDSEALIECAKVTFGSGNVPLAKRLCTAARYSARLEKGAPRLPQVEELVNLIYKPAEARTILRSLHRKPGWVTASQLASACAPAVWGACSPTAISEVTLCCGLAWFVFCYALALRN